MKKLTTLFAVALFFISTAFSQAPANSRDVMLQGFYWNSNSETSWLQLYQMSGDISGNFDIVWLPPSAASTGGSGYMPKQWSSQNSEWGERHQLQQLINALKSNNCRAMADIVVNHRADNGIAPYKSFYTDDFTPYGIFTLGECDIVSNDDVPGCGAHDDYEIFNGARDLDHTSSNVKNAVKAYLKWMKDIIGYEGWRYDMVKGFMPSVIGEYNDAANAYMSVGEHWSGDGEIKTWINYTGSKSAAFDFPLKYSGLHDGLWAGNYSYMNRGIAFDPNYSRYAVTFVDNHDTYCDRPTCTRDHNHNNEYRGNILQAYAFLMSSPGIPCVFYPHWRDNKTAINDMIKARKSIGMTSQTSVDVQNTSGYYKVFIDNRTNGGGMMLTYIGNNGSDAPTDPGWNLVASGGSGSTSYKIYTNISNSEFLDAHLLKIANGANPPALPTLNTITIKAIVPAAWTAPKIHAWAVGGALITSGAWPGQAMTREDGNKYTITLSGFSTPIVGAVINNGASSGTLQTINLYTTQNVCWDVTSTATDAGKYGAAESATCQATSSINEVEAGKFSIYPNPAENILNIYAEKEISKVTVLSVSGQNIMVSDNNYIDVSALGSGIYFLKIEFANSQTVFEKFLKK